MVVLNLEPVGVGAAGHDHLGAGGYVFGIRADLSTNDWRGGSKAARPRHARIAEASPPRHAISGRVISDGQSARQFPISLGLLHQHYHFEQFAEYNC